LINKPNFDQYLFKIAKEIANIMAKIRFFRIWFYFRTGYQLYFAFIFAGINTMIITYFLAIDRAPILKEVFPSFGYYAMVLIGIGIPILTITGLLHFKRIPAFKTEQEVAYESNPYVYKLPPGHQMHVVMPFFRLQSEILLKIAENKKLTEEEITKMKELQKKMDHLLEGNYIGTKGRKLSFGQDEKI